MNPVYLLGGLGRAVLALFANFGRVALFSVDAFRTYFAHLITRANLQSRL